MISAFANVFKVPDLRSRILFTLAMIVIVRIGASITLPGVDASVLDEWVKIEAVRKRHLPRLGERGRWIQCAASAVLRTFHLPSTHS